jgi:hypothetical protein
VLGGILRDKNNWSPRFTGVDPHISRQFQFALKVNE